MLSVSAAKPTSLSNSVASRTWRVNITQMDTALGTYSTFRTTGSGFKPRVVNTREKRDLACICRNLILNSLLRNQRSVYYKYPKNQEVILLLFI